MESPLTLLLLGAGFLILLVFLHVPVGAAMAIAGVVAFGLYASFPAAFAIVGIETASALTNADLATIPLFVLMGNLAARAGLSAEIFRIANALLGRWRGGLSMATVAGCAGFGAICGSSIATTATMARIALPEMRRRGYGDELSAGSIAAGGGLGMLIPPSLVMIVYAVLTEQFVLDLFTAAILPGLLTVLLYSIAITIWVRLRPEIATAGERAPPIEVLRALAAGWRTIVIVATVMGGIYSGVFTVIEAASIAAALTLGFFLARPGWRVAELAEVLVETARTTGTLFLLVIGASVFGYFLTVSGGAKVLVEWVSASGLNAYGVVIAILFIYIVMGAFFDSIAAMVLTIPFVLPLVVSLGFDPVWWGVVNVIVIEVGLITPPIGMNVFILHGVARDVTLPTIFRGVWPFVGADILLLGLLVAFPQIALFHL